ncbi:MAG: nuclear transport factor 2 family protein [Wenzhouxiangella sp.]|nr:MAG: nuclear transport factor 2 family protein [Wenzhouxiangella sp.]
MNSITTSRLLLIAALSLLVSAGCFSRGDTRSVDDDLARYEQAMRDFPGHDAAIDRGVEQFARAYADLTDPALADLMISLYAERLFFNDTLHSFDQRSDLIAYLTRTGAALAESEVEIKQVLRDGNDVFVRWTMEFRTRAAGRDIHSHSIGMTHLRFDSQGQIVLHQDFWDSGHALYAHLPVVGFAVRRARARM